jgi:betaine lipid synthase
VSTEWWAWKAGGVPKEQRDLIVNDFAELNHLEPTKRVAGEAIWQYVVDTLDPVTESTQLSRDNYFYHLCLQGRYSKKCHPRYMDHKSHAKLSRPGAFDGLRIHTDEIMEVIARMAPDTLTIAIVMDSMDWFPPVSEDARAQVVSLNKVLKMGGRVMFRSAARRPWYTRLFEENGFESKCEGLRRSGMGDCIDRVNMYASCWVCTKRRDVGGEEERGRGRGRASTLEELEI